MWELSHPFIALGAAGVVVYLLILALVDSRKKSDLDAFEWVGPKKSESLPILRAALNFWKRPTTYKLVQDGYYKV